MYDLCVDRASPKIILVNKKTPEADELSFSLIAGKLSLSKEFPFKHIVFIV